MDLSKEIWHSELYKLQQQAPKPVIVKCDSVVKNRPTQFGDEYHGNIDRNEVEKIMSDYGTGAFLIRDSQRNVDAFTLVIRFDQSNKNYVLYYNPVTRQHYVGSKYFDSTLNLVQDGLIHMYIETRGSDILQRISEAKVYEATPFYQSRFYAIKNETLRQNQIGKSKAMDLKGSPTLRDYNDSSDSGIFHSLRSEKIKPNKKNSSSDESTRMAKNTFVASSEDMPVHPSSQMSLHYSLCQKRIIRPSISSESPASIFGSSKSSSISHYDPIFNCHNVSFNNIKSNNVETLSSNSKTPYQRSVSVIQKNDIRSGGTRFVPNNRNTVIETSNSNNFSELEKNHNFRQHTFVGPQWCDFCAHFMWGLVAQGVQCFDCGFQAHKKCSDKVAADCCPNMKSLKRVFGVELISLAKMENRAVPMIFEKLILELEDRDMSFQGIYRIPGNIDLIEEVKAELDKDVDSVDLKTDPRLVEIETLSGLIKLFLRQLPIPLITSEIYPELIKILKSEPNLAQRQSQFREALLILNSVHYATLEFFIRHLNAVSKFHSQNCMTSSNLAIVFAPTLISKPHSQDTGDLSPEVLINRFQSDFKFDGAIIQELIEACDSIFSKVVLNES